MRSERNVRTVLMEQMRWLVSLLRAAVSNFSEVTQKAAIETCLYAGCLAHLGESV